MGDLTGKVAIITGAGRGLGREEALQLAGQGARVVINDIDRPEAKEAAEATVEEIRGFGGEAIAVYGDCADSNDANTLFKTALDTWGDVNIMVNNAGFCRDQTIFNMDDPQFDSVVNVHLRGHFVNMRNASAYWRGKAKQEGSVYGRIRDCGLTAQSCENLTLLASFQVRARLRRGQVELGLQRGFVMTHLISYCSDGVTIPNFVALSRPSMKHRIKFL